MYPFLYYLPTYLPLIKFCHCNCYSFVFHLNFSLVFSVYCLIFYPVYVDHFVLCLSVGMLFPFSNLLFPARNIKSNFKKCQKNIFVDKHFRGGYNSKISSFLRPHSWPRYFSLKYFRQFMIILRLNISDDWIRALVF